MVKLTLQEILLSSNSKDPDIFVLKKQKFDKLLSRHWTHATLKVKTHTYKRDREFQFEKGIY